VLVSDVQPVMMCRAAFCVVCSFPHSRRKLARTTFKECPKPFFRFACHGLAAQLLYYLIVVVIAGISILRKCFDNDDDDDDDDDDNDDNNDDDDDENYDSLLLHSSLILISVTECFMFLSYNTSVFGCKRVCIRVYIVCACMQCLCTCVRARECVRGVCVCMGVCRSYLCI